MVQDWPVRNSGLEVVHSHEQDETYFMEKINLLCSLLSLLLKNLHHLIHMSDSLGTTSSMDSATGVSDACHTGSILV